MIKVFYDTETTGVNFRRNSIIQLSGLIEVDSQVVEKFDFKVRPHPKAIIEEKALSVNRTTKEEIESYPEMSLVLDQFKAILKKYIDPFDPKQKAHLVGFNNRFFDDPFLRKFFELCGDNFIGSWFWADTIDVLVLASEYLAERRADMPNFKLKRVALELGIHVEESRLHDGLYDAELTRQIYAAVTERIPEPARQFYFYGTDDGEVWKQFEAMQGPEAAEYELSFNQFRKLLKNLGLKDGPHLIQDDLL